MTDPWTERWNERYRKAEYAYGTEPNEFLKEQLQLLRPGRILFPAEGEGRNAVYAARMGWQVSAFDISDEGQKKARALATQQGVTIDYQVGGFEAVQYSQNQFDAIAFIFAHFPAAIKSRGHQIMATYLRPGGTVIFEAFSKRHLDFIAKNERVGGPREIDMLFSEDELKTDFTEFEIVELRETEVELREGPFHQGRGSVIRFVGIKN
jgi:SAM-dependent methyltransferase